MGSGLPTISVRDMEIQKRENDLVLATFGRGIYILDDYSVSREIDKTFLEKDAHLFGVKDALMYMQTSGKYGQGSTFFSAPNPPFGAIFTYYLQKRKRVMTKNLQADFSRCRENTRFHYRWWKKGK